jgi:hypothetical protein
MGLGDGGVSDAARNSALAMAVSGGTDSEREGEHRESRGRARARLFQYNKHG